MPSGSVGFWGSRESPWVVAGARKRMNKVAEECASRSSDRRGQQGRGGNDLPQANNEKRVTMDTEDELLSGLKCRLGKVGGFLSVGGGAFAIGTNWATLYSLWHGAKY